LAADRCLPGILLQENPFTGTNHWIILGFFVLCSTLYLVTNGDVLVLSGVFAVAFLMVLICFASANILLKIRRPRLPRGAHATWFSTILGLSLMVAGLVGNVITNAYLIVYFLFYLAFYFSVIFITFQRVQIAKSMLFIVNRTPFLEKRFASFIVSCLIHMKVRKGIVAIIYIIFH
jgi:hypothetical protein